MLIGNDSRPNSSSIIDAAGRAYRGRLHDMQAQRDERKQVVGRIKVRLRLRFVRIEDHIFFSPCSPVGLRSSTELSFSGDDTKHSMVSESLRSLGSPSNVAQRLRSPPSRRNH